MCGIVALYREEKGIVDHNILLSMRDALIHRGPDDAGLYIDEHVDLAHRRLSIIDLSAGRQPMCDASGTVWIVFNGEIYNFLELRAELSGRGYRFKTRSDTEVILALYVTEGESFVQRLNGIFAFALWDTKDRKLLLVRDRIGVKPLYIWRGKGIVAVASEIKALLAYPEVNREVNLEAIPEYLAFRQLAGKTTMFKSIEVLGPGEMMILRGTTVTTRTYWELPRCQAGVKNVEQDYIDRLESLLSEAVEMQLVSDVPLGTFNSGGVDSSLVTSYVAAKAADNLNTFCIGLTDPRLDERGYAEIVARKYRTAHHSLVVDNAEYADNLSTAIWHYDEPLNHPNTVPIYLLSKRAKQLVTVVLTGEGCDEFFGGYPRYRIGAFLQALGKFGRLIGRNLVDWVPHRLGGQFEKMRAALKLGPVGAVMQASRYVGDDDLTPLLHGDLVTISSLRNPQNFVDGDLVSRMLEQDQRHYLLPILNRLDKATMAVGLEARVPFLDHRLVEYASTVPSSMKIHHGQTKYLVKRVAIQRLPKEIVFRKKSGFSLPLADWFRQQAGLGRYLDMLLEPRSLQRSYLEGRRVRMLVDEHRGGTINHTEILWGLINLELWHRMMIEQSI